MERKIVNCPHCGKIISPKIFAGKIQEKVECPGCGSLRTVKNGKRHAPAGVIQRYSCLKCGLRFSKY